MKVLLTGAGGQVGRCIQDVFSCTNHELLPLDRGQLDITDKERVLDVVREFSPDVIINAAAYTSVDRAEKERELARAVNALGAENIAIAAMQVDALLIHFSTDYVFDGNKTTPYIEEDATNPQSVYGETKLEGERAIRRVWGKHFILRTSWVFSEYGNNFFKTMLRLAREDNEIRVVDDQYGCPAYAGDIATACLKICETDAEKKYGLYHYAGNEVVSWCEFARAILSVAGQRGKIASMPKVAALSTIDYPTAAKRPSYSVVSSAKFVQEFSLPPSNWVEGIERTFFYGEMR
ncbi:dTDP-4-dehydrorhamnose reductase [Spongiibacter sp. KMU-158]|uniref:dTDP-4-dehydrorhamnose reductase n=1 Tax=Spongiibacter pelagi TaxID=2760804 RepID=A0A927GWX0_9GAMM|nr:dTDP-4-dehydrorhamnose reductase [Spongiibacter pelagi]MBD2859382.1 dTDP-4-dehydrorhamnose reductase [Spongiibacter pelagi]